MKKLPEGWTIFKCPNREQVGLVSPSGKTICYSDREESLYNYAEKFHSQYEDPENVQEDTQAQ